MLVTNRAKAAVVGRRGSCRRLEYDSHPRQAGEHRHNRPRCHPGYQEEKEKLGNIIALCFCAEVVAAHFVECARLRFRMRAGGDDRRFQCRLKGIIR